MFSEVDSLDISNRGQKAIRQAIRDVVQDLRRAIEKHEGDRVADLLFSATEESTIKGDGLRSKQIKEYRKQIASLYGNQNTRLLNPTDELNFVCGQRGVLAYCNANSDVGYYTCEVMYDGESRFLPSLLFLRKNNKWVIAYETL